MAPHQDVAQAQTIDGLLRRTCSWIEGEEELDVETRRELESLSRSSPARLALLGQVLAVKRVQVVEALQRAQDVVLRRLLDPERIDRINDPRMLTRIAQLTHDLLEANTEFLERKSAGGVEPAVVGMLHRIRTEQEQDSGTVAVVEAMGPQKREALRQLFSKLKALKDGGAASPDLHRNGHALEHANRCPSSS